MNRFIILLLVLFCGALYYFKTQEQVAPAVKDPSTVSAEKPKEKIVQQALPEEAKHLTAEVKQDEIPEEVSENVKLENEKMNAAKEEIERQQRRGIASHGNKANDIVYIFNNSTTPLKWPCTEATYADIADGYNYTWGKKSVEPHDNFWYSLIAESVTEYAICRGAETAYSKTCWSLDFLSQKNDLSEFDNVYSKCRKTMVDFQSSLISAGKASPLDCEEYSKELNVPGFCSEVTKKRGASLCDTLKVTGEARNQCIIHFPASEGDCAAFKGKEATKCNDNLNTYNAIVSGDVKKCPSTGGIATACRAYVLREQNSCKSVAKKMSDNYCKGGKYASARTPVLPKPPEMPKKMQQQMRYMREKEKQNNSGNYAGTNKMTEERHYEKDKKNNK